MKRLLEILIAAAGFGLAALLPAAAAEGFDLVKLIRNADPGVRDAGGWAADMLSGFAENKIEANRENICATIAIISQESGFAANPTVPGLGKLAEKALKDKFSAIPFLGPKILGYLESVPDPKASFMDQIRAAKTERCQSALNIDPVSASKIDPPWI